MPKKNELPLQEERNKQRPLPNLLLPKQCGSPDTAKRLQTDDDQSIERNASTSPLLKLPAEIREKILSLVVGRKLIHLVYIRRRRIFRHAICTAASSEHEAHEEFMTGYTHIPTDDSADFYSPTFKKRHAHCKSWDLEDDRVWSDEERFLSRFKTKEERRKPMLNLRILGAYR